MAANNTIGLNIELPIYNSDGSSFHGLVLHKSTYDSVVMSLGDKITGDVYYPTNDLVVTTQEYVEYDGVKYQLVNHPTIVREGMATDNSQLKGMTKYSFVFYHPMYMLGNLPFTDVAVTSDETKYLSESKHFSWIGYPDDFFAKINKNLVGTEWIVEKSSRFPQDIENKLSEVLVFDENTIADAIKKVYDEWGIPYVVSQVASSETSYAQGKRFKVVFGLPSNEIYEDATQESHGTPFVFKFGQGVGLKNNSRTPRNNKIITRIAGYGSEDNVPYGYPQIPWYGDSRWDYTEYEGSTINYDADGHVTNTPKTTAYPLYMGIVGGAYVKLIKHPFTRTTLMPSVFSQTIFNKVSPYMPDGTANASYDPNTTIVDYYDAITSEEYPYPNPIVPNAPSYESHQFEDIKPELGDEEIDDAWPINDSDRQRADAWDDSLDEDGNYKQGYFKVKLPILSFDIYACAAITQEMQINMRSGACLGCTFTVQVDWDAYKKNFYDADGNFVPNGTQRDYNAFPNSKNVEVELILQKDTTTFGTLMPNVYQQPEQGDLFVVLGISLPLSYITNAEERLDNEMKSYMLENNVHYFDYPLKFDEDFLCKNTNILSQIRPNSIIRFEYADSQLSLYVKQLTIKYGESALPKYDITLTDNVDIILNQIGQVADDIERISSIISILRQNYGKNVWYELSKKLSRVDDDVAYGNMRFRKNVDVDGNLSVGENATFGGNVKANTIQSSEFTGDGMLDTGFKIWYENGRAKMVIDDLIARGKFSVNELESRIWTYAGGNMVFSGAGSTIFYVEYLDANDNTLGYTNIFSPWLLRGKALLAGQVAWSKRKQIMRKLTDAEKLQVAKFRCYEYSDNGTMQTRNWWHINDLAFCETLNHVKDKGTQQEDFANTVYWRKVLAVGCKTIPAMNDGRVYDYVDLSLSDHAQDYNDWPAAGDVIVQRGNVSDVSRQSMVSIEITGDVFHGIKIYDSISGYNMGNTEWISLGYDVQTGKAKANVFGDFRFGCRENEEANGGSYIKYNRTTKQLDIRANVRFTSPTTQQETTLDNFASAVTGDLTNLQNQIDGQIESWFYNYAPVSVDESGAPTSTTPLNVAPYSDWTTDNDKIAHLGDTFTNNSTGYCWRFSRNSTTNAFEWVIIEDSAVITALQNAARAQDTADHKRRVFTTTPFPPYEVGDLWAQGSSGELMRCIYTRTATESYTATDWDKASKYTDDTKVNTLISELLNGASDTEAAMTTAFKAIRAAMNEGETNIYGGLILTNDIELRDTASTPSVRAGISGMYDSTAQGGGVAIWAGGARGDWEAYFNSLTPAQQAQATITSAYAKAVDRFDGSGYRASGNISWDSSGNVTLKGQTVKSTAYYLGDKDITNKLNAVLSMFEIETINGVEWVHVLNNRPLYSDSDISALGAASGGGGGDIGSLSDLDDVSINNPSNGQMLVYDSQSSHWLNQTVNLVTSLANLTDVSIGSQTNGQALIWNSSTSKWVAGDMSVNRINGSVQSGSCVLGGTHIGWINIARFDLNQYGNNESQAFDLYVRRLYNSPESESFTCNISIGWNTGNIKVLNRVADHAIVDYIRVADSGNYRYIQLYVNPTYSTYENYTSFSIIGTTGSWESVDEVASGTYTEVCSCVLAAESGVAYQATDNNLISHTNEFNFVPSGFNLDIYINYRTVGGQNGSIGKYIFCDGAGNSLAQLDNSNGGTILTQSNVKTINGNSIFGTGDIVISGGGGSGGNYLPLAGGTLTGLLGINTNGNTVTIGSQNNEWCHFYNSANVPFIFNKDVWTIGGLMPYDGSTYDIGSASRRWKSFYVGSINASGTSVLVGGAKFGYVCVECNSDGTAVGGYSSEINNFSGALYLQHGSSQNLALCTGGGNVGIGTTNPSYKLHVAGDIYATGDVTAASDERAKDVISNVVLDINDIANAPAIKFTWKDKRDELQHVGSIAQYWQKILPESVSDRNDVLGLNYGGAVMVGLVSVAKEVVSQDKRNNEQDEQIKELERQLNKANEKIISLENEVERLKSA